MAISGNFANTGGYPTPSYAPNYAQQVAQRYGFGAGTTPAPAPSAAPPAPTYAQQQAQRFGLAGAGQTYANTSTSPQPFGMAGAGLQYGAQQPAAARPAAPAAPAAPSGPPLAGTPSVAGATTPNPGGTMVNGQFVPSITQTTTLSPEEQAILNKTQTFQQSMLGAGNQLAGAIPTGGLNLSGAPAMPTGGQFNQSASDAVYQQQTAMLDPQWQMQEQQLTDSLRDQGIPPGSDAYNKAMTLFQNQKTTAYQQAKDAAIQEGYNVANQQFQQGMAARQQGVSEAGQQYQMPVSNLAQLMGAYTGTGGVQAPQGQAQPSPIQPADMGQNFKTMQDALQAQYAAQANMYGQNVGGLSGLAGMMATAAMFA